MLIGIDASRTTAAQRTGTEAYATFLVQAIIPLAAKRGHRLRLYFNHPPPANLFPELEHVEQLIIPFPRLWTHMRLAWEVTARPPDVFFTPAHVIPFTFRGPSAVTIHDLGYYHFPEAHPKGQLAYLRWSTRHNARLGRRVVADSLATKKDLVRLDGIDPSKIDVIYPGVDPELQPVEDRTELTRIEGKYGIKSPYLLHIGTIQPRKNLVRLVIAFRESQIPYQLVLAGKAGWLSQPILDQISSVQASAKGRIVLPGYVPDADKAALISGATALLFPSLYEGFGFPVLEAQACGTAVLCANSSSLPEIAGESALLVDPLDTAALTTAIERITIDAPLRQRLVRKGFENVRRFSWPQAAAQLLTTLELAAGISPFSQDAPAS